MPVGMHCQKVYLYISEGKRNHKNVPRTINRKMKDLEASHSFKNCLAFSLPSFLWLASLQEGRAVQFQRVQYLPRTGSSMPGPTGRFSRFLMQVHIPFQKEFSAGKLDCPLQKKTQKRTVGRN